MYDDQEEHETPEPGTAPAWAGVGILVALLSIACAAIGMLGGY
jgi:hypothetical protein